MNGTVVEFFMTKPKRVAGNNNLNILAEEDARD
jgi:hypothetical protein